MATDHHIALSGLQKPEVIQEMFNAMARGDEWRVIYKPHSSSLTYAWRLKNYEVLPSIEPEEEISMEDAALDMHIKIMAKAHGIRTLNEWVKISEERLATMGGFSPRILTNYKKDLANIGNYYPGLPLGTSLPYRPVGTSDVRKQNFSEIVAKRNVIIVAPQGTAFVAMERAGSMPAPVGNLS